MNELERRNQAVTRRSLLDTRQALGIVPTWWFWNDWEQQRLLMPLTLLTSTPLALLFVAAAAAGVSVWWTMACCLVYPFVLMGLVERRVRAGLGRPPAQAVALPNVTRRRPGSVRIAALTGALLSATILTGLAGAPIAVPLALAFACAACLTWLLAPTLRAQVRRLRTNAARALPEPKER